MSLEHWKYYIALEADLQTIARYVEPAPANYGTYSVELTKLFLSACAEVEAICKLLCASQNLTLAYNNMDHYRPALYGRYPGLHTLEVRAPRYELALLPWSEWANGKNPKWWSEHNDVKHSRHTHFQFATLENALNATAGLSVLLQYHYVQERIAGKLINPTEFFERDGDGGIIIAGGKPPPNS